MQFIRSHCRFLTKRLKYARQIYAIFVPKAPLRLHYCLICIKERKHMDDLLFLSECVSSIHPMSVWEFDRECNLLRTNCPGDRHPGSFVYTDLRALLKHFAFTYSRPSIVSGKFPIMWIIDSKPGTDGPDRLFAFGPFFYGILSRG